MIEQINKVVRESRQLMQVLGREPTDEEIADRLERRERRRGVAASESTTLEADAVVVAYKRDVDRTLLRENLRRTVQQRVENLMALQQLASEARRAGDAAL